MLRRARSIVGGYAYHVLNRANGRMRLFKKEADFAAFDRLIAEAVERVPLRILGYTVMGNHWHFVVWPRQRQNEQVSEFFRWLTVTHSQRWHAHHGTSGMGHVYQGRFKSFPIRTDRQAEIPARVNAFVGALTSGAPYWIVAQWLPEDDGRYAVRERVLAELGAKLVTRENQFLIYEAGVR